MAKYKSRLAESPDTPQEKWVGAKVGRLTILAVLQTNKWGNRLAHMKCDCGTEKEILLNSVVSGRTRSCGCLNVDKGVRLRAAKGQAGFVQLFLQYKLSAARRGHDFRLSEEEFRLLTTAPCFYCGALPDKVKKGKAIHAETIEWGSYTYNGIDRKNNEGPYDLDNCVTSCTSCNKMKKTFQFEEFLHLVSRIAKHRGFIDE